MDMRMMQLRKAIESTQRVAGYTHSFYRYPARFSPEFARTVISHWSTQGETILDPFMGGGTTLVEARSMGRKPIGCDISALAYFVSNCKTTLYSGSDLAELLTWKGFVYDRLKLSNCAGIPKEDARLRNMNTSSVWRIRNLIQKATELTKHLGDPTLERFARCAILKIGQWALDNRKIVPSTEEFRNKFCKILDDMVSGAKDFAVKVRGAEKCRQMTQDLRPICLHRSAVNIETEGKITKYSPPKLILTSPPYPGVHVVYHRWQIQGRRETPAPFWITDMQDDHPAQYYTLGDRKDKSLNKYMSNAEQCFTSLAKISSCETSMVQLVGFSEPKSQLPRYLQMLNRSGWTEEKRSTNRLWRRIPNRKWYAQQRGSIPSSREVVLIHRPT